MTTEIATPANEIANVSNFFDFEKAKVQTITLEQLQRTHKENDVYGNPIRGIYHFELINTILAECAALGYQTEIYDLFAAQNKDRNTPGVVLLPQVEAQFGERAVEAHILRRVFANIRLTDFDDNETTTNLAVAFHQKGIQVGFGPNVKICHNQCMLSPQYYAATYSDKGQGRGNGVTITELLDIVRGWLFNAKKIIVAEREKIERMKSIEVSAEKLFLLIGMMTAIRVKCDTTNKVIKENRTYPLNQSQITAFTEAMILKYHHAQRVTLWDVYNAATDLYKASSMEIPSILPQNRALVAFLDEQFGL